MINTGALKIDKKVCGKCNKNKDINLFFNRQDSKDGKNNICKACKKEKNIIYRKNNKEKIRLIKQKYAKTERCKKKKREYYYKNIEAIREKNNIQLRIYREKNRDQLRKAFRKRKRNYIRDLHDTYIKELIVQGSNLRHRDISQDIVDAKREYLKLKRHLKK